MRDVSGWCGCCFSKIRRARMTRLPASSALRLDRSGSSGAAACTGSGNSWRRWGSEMSVKAAPQTETDAIIARLLTVTDDTSRRALIAQNSSFDWDTIVSTLTDRARQQINVN